MTKSSIYSGIALFALVVLASTSFAEVFGYGGSSGTRVRDRAFSTPTPVQTVAAQTETKFVFNTNLFQGLQNNDVMELQKRLRAAGFFTFPTDTGFFGPITLEAVKAFQRANGIPDTGFVGPLTREALNK